MKVSIRDGGEILQEARKFGYAVGGFDVFNLESAQAVLWAAEELQTPVFLQVCAASAEYMGLEYAISILKEAASQATVPVAIHLDHGPEGTPEALIKRAVEIGFTSVMIDGSMLSLEENIRLTKRIGDMAHARGVCVEAELGKVSRNLDATREELQRLMTNPKQAQRFVSETKADYLAVSVGSVSGFYKGTIALDLHRLAEIGNSIAIPLVLHGGTSIPPAEAEKAIRLGVSKINVAHGLRRSFLDALRQGLEQDTTDPRVPLGSARFRAKEYVKQKIQCYRKEASR